MLFYVQTQDIYCGHFVNRCRDGKDIYIDQEAGEEFDGLWENDEALTRREDDETFTGLATI